MWKYSDPPWWNVHLACYNVNLVVFHLLASLFGPEYMEIMDQSLGMGKEENLLLQGGNFVLSQSIVLPFLTQNRVFTRSLIPIATGPAIWNRRASLQGRRRRSCRFPLWSKRRSGGSVCSSVTPQPYINRKEMVLPKTYERQVQWWKAHQKAVSQTPWMLFSLLIYIAPCW